ncbi:MAG: methylamine utilization protein [Phenylobacterium sp.]|nr:methylamine utilization protein [Phenylobacterium sp.]
MMRLLAALILGLVAAPAWAGDVTVSVRNPAGQPVQDAVVMIMPSAGVPAGALAKAAGSLVVAQKDVQFQPYVTIAPVGSTVSFPNRDKVRHHVYSFSPTKRFEIKLYGREENRTITFDKPGAVSLGCNIHDQMIAYIYVTETPYAAKTDANGVAVVRGAPSGASRLAVWHPHLKARAPVAQALRVAGAAQRAAATIDLRPAVRR